MILAGLVLAATPAWANQGDIMGIGAAAMGRGGGGLARAAAGLARF